MRHDRKSLADDTARRAGRVRWWILVLCAVPILIIAWVAIVLHLRDRRIKAALESIRAAGEPATPADLDAMYEAPPVDRDTTDLWLDAIAPLDKTSYYEAAESLPYVDRDAEEPPLPGEPWPELEAAEALLNQYAESLRLMHEAAKRGGAARFPVDFDKGIQVDVPHAVHLRSAALLLKLQAEVRAHRGDADGAADSVHAMFAVARSLEYEPVVVSLLARTACIYTADKLICRLLGTVEFDEDTLVDLQNEVRAAADKDPLYRALLGERVNAILVTQDPSGTGGTGLDVVAARWYLRSQLPYMLTKWTAILEALKKPWPQPLDEFERMQREVEEDYEDRSGSLSFALAIPAHTAALNAVARATALNRAADAGIAVARYRLRHGRLPENLEQLVPEFLPSVPADPFTGEPLLYSILEDGYAVYSVGRDRVDNGGKEPAERDGEEDTHLVFRVRTKRAE